MKVTSGVAAVAIVAAAWLTGPVPAAADDDETPIDCGKTSMQFTETAFEVKCTAFENEQIHQSDGSAQVQVQMLSAFSNRTADWLIAIDFRILGSLAIRRNGLEDNIHSYFRKLETKNWKSGGDVQGFETAEFVSEGNDDLQDCVGFQRYVNRRYNGFSRWVVGFVCSSDGKESAYKTLAGFSGPGG